MPHCSGVSSLIVLRWWPQLVCVGGGGEVSVRERGIYTLVTHSCRPCCPPGVRRWQRKRRRGWPARELSPCQSFSLPHVLAGAGLCPPWVQPSEHHLRPEGVCVGGMMDKEMKKGMELPPGTSRLLEFLQSQRDDGSTLLTLISSVCR